MAKGKRSAGRKRLTQRVSWDDRYSIPSPLEVILARGGDCPKCLGELDDDLICRECCFDALDFIIYPETFP